MAVALACALGTATTASAAGIGGAVSGTVTDADTGLPLGGTALTWWGTTSPPPATANDAGDYLLTGLAAGTVGTLAVAGPAGYERTSIPNLALPADGAATRDVALHRDWAAGAPTTAAPDATGAPGCEPTKATDNDTTTGWSTSQPATLTVQLPAPVDVGAVVLTPGAACGHPDGAALKDYKIETSPDGVTWSAAATGALSPAGDQAVAVTAAATRFVRLSALAAQDAAAASIDLRELQVYGGGPNVAPSGTVAPLTPKSYIKSIVRLRAAFTDPDSTIVRYLWDFDGDGRFDQATAGPQVAHVWSAAGTYAVTVGARDFRGALGTTTLALRIIDPSVPVEPIIQRKPLIAFDPVDGIDLPVRIACSSICTFTAKLVLPRSTAKAIHAKRRTILTMKERTEGPGLGSWTIELPSKTIKLLRRAHRASVKVRLTATAVDQQRRRSNVARWVRFR
ncbi:discoidin domain-containing protein [Baekduia sp.]|uniref:discoidin domain-containing protein n=1 Tax=Baekduia sp. TaxID=2600305 RepID=UPI002D776DDA|nr:discoidin domain-containing protein [Baekduia sp.]